MPIIDSEYQIYIEDSKPTKTCQYRGCPNHPDYVGLKLKACKRCGWVRYCGKACQSEDWQAEHRRVCKIPPIIDIGAWIHAYRWLFQWACYEGPGRDGVDRTATHFLRVCLIRTDRLVGPTPCHFLVDHATIVDGDSPDATFMGFPPPFVAPDKRTRAIRAAGGLGSTRVMYIVGGGDMTMFRYDTIELPAPLSATPPTLGWQAVVRAVANGDMQPGEFLNTFDANPQSEEAEELGAEGSK